jgi:putative ATPase
MSGRDQSELFSASRPVSAQGAPSFAAASEKDTPSSSPRHRPLAARMRPRRLSEVAGQDHLLGPNALLPRLIANGQFGSILLYGPPGCGKTSLAEVIAEESGSRFVRLNAVLSNVAELRDVLKMARYRSEERTLLFIDEIHRFNKAQQDLLLPDVEAGVIRLIGATTHNPGFYVIPPLLSRSHLCKLEPVPLEVVAEVLERALHDVERGLGGHQTDAAPGVLGKLARMADGDLRRALNALETLTLSLPMGTMLEDAHLEAFARERQIRYDAGEDEHYDTASAFIKSMRGGDPDAALYWLAKMLIGGEDPRFIARRLVIFASEDVGLADPRALPMATATFQACEQIGLPECELNLAHCVVFLATAPKSNSTTMAISAAKKSIRENGLQNVPLWLRDGHTKLNRALGQGDGYRYSHEYPEAISGQEYMVSPETYYESKASGAEAHIVERLKRWKELKAERRGEM